MQVVILAGGLATRMKHITETIPKALIPIGERPFIHYQLGWLSRSGIKDVVLSIGYRGKQIQDYVGSGEKWGLRVQYVDEGTNLKGTGGALRLCYDQGVLEESFFVTYGDSFLPVDFREVWSSFRGKKEPALMTVLRNENQWDESNAIFHDGRVVFYSKKKDSQNEPMHFIDYGLCAFRREIILEKTKQGAVCDLAEILTQLAAEGRLSGFEVKSRFYEIGSTQGLEDFKQFVYAKLKEL